MIDLDDMLRDLERDQKLPEVTAYNRIDGPGSSLDLREFQQALWLNPETIPENYLDSAEWTRGLPRTIGITIDIGTRVSASPFDPGWIRVISEDYGYDEKLPAGSVPFVKRFWLLRILDAFGLSGVQFTVRNIIPDTKSSGLGGSATATTAVCLLANELAGRPFNGDQIVAMASMIEQDMDVSITGTQEQANVVYGGVTDYVWFPWGIPRIAGSYGASVRYPLVDSASFGELQSRLRVYHSGLERASTNVNTVWRNRLKDSEGFALHRSQLETAYEFRESIRESDWAGMVESVRLYRAVRTELCASYMTSTNDDIQRRCEKYSAESFPLGAGGGGALCVFGQDPTALDELDTVLESLYRHIPIRLRENGHEFRNTPEPQ